jgi:uncharacterized protein YjdB
MTLSFNAIKTKHTFNGKSLKRVVIDSTTSTLKSGQNWTAQVVTPDNLSTIVQKVVGVTGIALNKSTTSIVAGNDETLTATLTPSGATGSIAWYTSNAAVATVEDGVVTAIAEGTATVSAMVDGLADVCEVTVTES